MAQGGYLGGSSIDGPGYAWYRADAADGEASRNIDAELRQIMAEHDRLRSLGINPMQHIKKAKKSRKAAQRAKKRLKRAQRAAASSS